MKIIQPSICKIAGTYYILESNLHSWTPPPLPILKGGGRTFQKLSHLGEGAGVQKLLLERGDKPVVDVKIGVCHFFITLQFNLIYYVCGGK